MKVTILLVLALFSFNALSQTTSTCALPTIPTPIESYESSVEGEAERMKILEYDMNYFMESIVDYRDCLVSHQNSIDPDQEESQQQSDEISRLLGEADDQENTAINRFNSYIESQN